MHKLLLLAVVAAVIFVSGCTGLQGGGTATSYGNGVVIEAFEADFPQAFAGETIQLQAKVRNTGSVDAKDITAILTGLESWDTGSGGNCNGATQTKPSLLAPSSVYNTEGESDTSLWTCTAPTGIPKGLSVSYNPNLRVYYSSESSVIKAINIVSQAEMRRIQQQGGTFPAETLSATTGPIAMNIQTKGPIRVFNGQVTFPIEITLSNAGGGVACPDVNNCMAGTDWNLVNVKVEVPSGSGLTLQECDRRTVLLWRGQSNSIVCQASVSGAGSGVVQQVVQATATYGYFVDKSTTVSVTGTK